MRRRVAICKFIPADYARWEGQEGVGLQGENATDLEQKNGGSIYSLPPFLEPPCFGWWFRRFFLQRLLRLLLLHRNFSDDRIWKGCLYVCFERLTTSPDNIRTAVAALHILAWLSWQLTATPRTKHVSVFRHHVSPYGFVSVNFRA